MLGHKHLLTAMIYTHVAKKNILGVRSPLDSKTGQQQIEAKLMELLGKVGHNRDKKDGEFQKYSLKGYHRVKTGKIHKEMVNVFF